MLNISLLPELERRCHRCTVTRINAKDEIETKIDWADFIQL